MSKYEEKLESHIEKLIEEKCEILEEIENLKGFSEATKHILKIMLARKTQNQLLLEEKDENGYNKHNSLYRQKAITENRLLEDIIYTAKESLDKVFENEDYDWKEI